MKKIWKVWTVILVVAATVLLTISTQYSKKEEISTDSYQYLIGVSLPNVIEPWLNNFVDVFTEKVSQDKKINVIFRDAAGNPEKQIQDIETLMEYGIDILIVSPDGSDSLSSVLSEAFQKIPVILTGVGAGTEDYTCLIKSDDQKIGRLPVFCNVDLKDIIEIRQNYGQSFRNFRSKLGEKLIKLNGLKDDEMLKRELDAVSYEITETYINDITKEISSLKRSIGMDGIILTGTLLTSYATGGLSLLGSVAATISAMKDSTKLFGDVRENPGYFLWKIDKKNRRKW